MKPDAPEEEVSFDPLQERDLLLIAEWLKTPHWQEWWGESETELGYIRDMIAGHDTTRPFLFRIAGMPAGYIQYWFVADQIEAGWDKKVPWLNLLPADAIGVDLSIGPDKLLSRGYGSAILRKFSKDLAARGFKEIFIDPDTGNKRAINAYRKAGYVSVPELQGNTGKTLIMKFQPE
jgi:aminoglycoside 6'-N-acetyltransferase